MPAGTVSPQDASGFVSLADALPDILLEIRYFSTYNFIGERIDGYTAPRALMTREAAQALSRVSQAAIAASISRSGTMYSWDTERKLTALTMKWRESASIPE